ncbi:DNA-directed RNA polymerase II subunit RPB1-like, partial [Arapaima gigas]
MFSAAFKTFVFEVFLRLLATFLVFGSESLSVDLRLRGEHTFAGTEKLQQLVPLVQCDDNSMTLLLQGCRSSSLLVDRADAPPLPLSRLPPSCGFSVKRARRDLLLVAPYDGCHVAREGGRYVLPLRIYGAPLKMSCPVTSSSPPTVSCEDSNMVVKVEGAANEAGFTIQLLTMAGETTLSCPPVQAKPTRSVPPVHPIFPPYYPMSFYTLYPTKAPPTLSPVHPKYAYYPIPFPDKYPKAPLSNAPPAKINPRYQFYQMPYSSAPVPRR